MEIITAYKADDGRVYLTEIEALRASVTFWKERAKELYPYKQASEEKERQESSYGDHQ